MTISPAELWTELHTYAWRYPCEPTAEDQRHARAWLARFQVRIPSYGCTCLTKWRRLIKLAPADLSGRAAFYWWTVAAHDRVNYELDKPLAAPDWSTQHAMFSDLLPLRNISGD